MIALLQASSESPASGEQLNTGPVRIGALVLLIAIVAIIVVRRMKKKKKAQDDF